VSQQLRIDESFLIYASDSGGQGWSLPIDAIVLIAEFTTDEGPWVEDYFLTFVTIEDGQTFCSTCPVFAGTDTVLTEISRRFDVSIGLTLVKSTEWKSRILWPP
jgi:hypothetical protein